MTKRDKRGLAKPPSIQATTPCTTYRARLIRGFTQALHRLGVQAEIDIPAELEDFMRDIRERVPLEELKSKWDYKGLQKRDGRRARVHQIRVCTHYRVALIRSEKACLVFFLNAYRRATNNDPDIAVAVQRALDIRREINEL